MGSFQGPLCVYYMEPLMLAIVTTMSILRELIMLAAFTVLMSILHL